MWQSPPPANGEALPYFSSKGGSAKLCCPGPAKVSCTPGHPIQHCGYEHRVEQKQKWKWKRMGEILSSITELVCCRSVWLFDWSLLATIKYNTLVISNHFSLPAFWTSWISKNQGRFRKRVVWTCSAILSNSLLRMNSCIRKKVVFILRASIIRHVFAMAYPSPHRLLLQILDENMF